MGKKLIIQSNTNANMSNWQIAHMMNVLTTANNKFDVLNKMNSYILNGIDKSNIFIMDRSYSFYSGYATYFGENQINNDGMGQVDIVKLGNMGFLVPLYECQRIEEINQLLLIYKAIVSFFRKRYHCKFRDNALKESYIRLQIHGINDAIDILISIAKQQIADIYERRLSPQDSDLQNDIRDCETLLNKKMRRMGSFYYYFKTNARPIIGFLEESSGYFSIINADQLYKNGEEAKNQIKLNEITKNSPVMMSFLLAGAMASVMMYLTSREMSIDKRYIESEDEAIRNIVGTVSEKDNSIICDQDVLGLGLDTIDKLESALKKTTISMEDWEI